MLQAGKTNNLTFKVNVFGTSALPIVWAVLGTSPELRWQAAHVADNNWSVQMDLPENVEGTYSLKIEVVVNDRLFMPISKSVEVTRPAVPYAAVEPVTATSEIPIATTPTVETAAPTATVTGDIAKVPSLLRDPRIVSPVKRREKKPTPMIRRTIPATLIVKQPIVVPKQTTGLTMLKTIAETPARKKHKRIVTDLPKPNSIVAEAKPVSIADIDTITTAPAKALESTPAVHKRQSRVPIKLIKEHLFYE